MSVISDENDNALSVQMQLEKETERFYTIIRTKFAQEEDTSDWRVNIALEEVKVFRKSLF